MRKGSDWDIDVHNIPDKAFVVYWDSEHRTIDNCVIYAETVAPLSLIEAIKAFRPEFAKGANITFQYISGTLSITNVMRF